MNMIRTTLLVAVALLIGGCYNYLERPRPMSMRCSTEKSKFIKAAAETFQNNGYALLEMDTASGRIMVQDTLDSVAYRYTALVRTWMIDHNDDSVTVQVWSVSTRKDGSDVKQTWDKKWSDDIVKDWMRPVMTSLEATCGLGSPLLPTAR